MIRHSRLLALGLAASALGGCHAGPDSALLAQAEGHDLTVEDAAVLLANQGQLPNQPEIVEALADLWIDHILLATAALEDSLLETIDLRPLVRSEIEQELVFRLRDQVIQVDTMVTDEELEALWMGAGPDGQVTARHILLSVASDATDTERDSVRALAVSLKERAERGEDFSNLAQEYSQDRGSAVLGGDLGTFGRGEMVGPFEDVAFALEPGEISDPVETIYGYHVIRVDSKDIESLADEENRVAFLAEIRASRLVVAESIYIAGIEEPANVTLASGAIAVMRELARRPGQRLSRRAGDRSMTKYEGGDFSAGEFQEFIQSRPPAFRQQIPDADSLALDGLLRTLTRGKLLVEAAEERGFQLSPEHTDSLMAAARSRFVLAATQLGLVGIELSEGQDEAGAVAERVMFNLAQILQGQRDVIPLGIISYALRQKYHGELFESAVPDVVAQVATMGTPPGRQPNVIPAGPQRAPNAPPPEADSTAPGSEP